MASQKIALEGRTRLPGRIQDVIVDCGNAVNQALQGSGSNNVLHATLKSFATMDAVIDSSINNVNKLESLVQHMNNQLDSVEANIPVISKIQSKLQTVERAAYFTTKADATSSLPSQEALSEGVEFEDTTNKDAK